LTTAQIIEGCYKNDAMAQRMLYDRYRGYACKVVFRYIYRYEKTMDIVTDGFIKLFKNFSRFKVHDPGNEEKILMAWLKKIMINCSIDELRRNNMIPEIGGISDEVWDIKENEANAEQLLLYKDIISMLKELPPQYGTVFNLYVIDGYSHSEIAEIMHISVSTSRANLTRAKEMLQGLIKKMEEPELWRI
jgi:RNA polymerase sigma factor (sigma-70 family)